MRPTLRVAQGCMGPARGPRATILRIALAGAILSPGGAIEAAAGTRGKASASTRDGAREAAALGRAPKKGCNALAGRCEGRALACLPRVGRHLRVRYDRGRV